MAKDPVCGMTVNEEKAAAVSVFEGNTYYFCKPGCKTHFDADSEQSIPDAPMGRICIGPLNPLTTYPIPINLYPHSYRSEESTNFRGVLSNNATLSSE